MRTDRRAPCGLPRESLICSATTLARLPREPFRGPGLDRQLSAAAREFFAKPLHIALDETSRTVQFSQIEFYTDDFLAKASSLIDYANRHRASPIPADYKVSFTPYDWTRNQRCPAYRIS